jgi:hypothetical protein
LSLRESPRRETAAETGTTAFARTADDEQWWLCAACDARVTPVVAAIEVAGAHRHVFTNPLGYAYDIGCFRVAPGCRCRGESTLQHTWFTGYAWRYAECGGCGEHVGWSYRRGAGQFFGLITQRLRRAG